jgi:hypothetical protein
LCIYLRGGFQWTQNGVEIAIPLSTNPCNVKMPARRTLYVPLGNMAQYLSYVQRPLNCPFILLVLPVFEYRCRSTIFRRFTSESDLSCESHFGVHRSNCGPLQKPEWYANSVPRMLCCSNSAAKRVSSRSLLEFFLSISCTRADQARRVLPKLLSVFLV